MLCSKRVQSTTTQGKMDVPERERRSRIPSALTRQLRPPPPAPPRKGEGRTTWRGGGFGARGYPSPPGPLSHKGRGGERQNPGTGSPPPARGRVASLSEPGGGLRGRQREPRVRDASAKRRNPTAVPLGFASVADGRIVCYGAAARPRRQPGARPNPPFPQFPKARGPATAPRGPPEPSPHEPVTAASYRPRCSEPQRASWPSASPAAPAGRAPSGGTGSPRASTPGPAPP